MEEIFAWSLQKAQKRQRYRKEGLLGLIRLYLLKKRKCCFQWSSCMLLSSYSFEASAPSPLVTLWKTFDFVWKRKTERMWVL